MRCHHELVAGHPSSPDPHSLLFVFVTRARADTHTLEAIDVSAISGFP